MNADLFFHANKVKFHTIRLLVHHGKQHEFVRYRIARSGFTLVELLAAIAIIAILAALAIPSYGTYITNVRNKRCIVEIRLLEQEITLYKDDKGRLPDTLADISRGDLMDPWGHPYQYLSIADSVVNVKGRLRRDKAINPLNSDYDLFSMGKDGVFKKQLDAKESVDDIVRARDGAFIDLAENF